uniref:23S rRNA methyltransferase/RumA n=1 Tax=Paulinella longichromatophora TaxID=1708747 RepID=A0A2H4ZNS9_9EUKA|nr:23S rRNA methyltransferase/RumA [Paulinella longichromatophora]
MIPKVCDLLEVSVFDLSLQGIGVARWNEKVVFTPGLLPGETGIVRVTHSNQEACIAILVRQLNKSSFRHRPPCTLSKDCGGCTLQSINETGQVTWKQHHVMEVMRRVGKLDARLLPLIKTRTPFQYRNKALVPLERLSSGLLRAGFYQSSSHYIVNMDRCPLLDPRIDNLIAPIKADLETSSWPINIHGTGSGGLRHLSIKIGVKTGEVLITLISSHNDLMGIRDLAQNWMRRWPQVVGVCLNIQPNPNNIIVGNSTRVIAGRAWIIEQFCNLDLRITAETFFQVNTIQAERIVNLLVSILNASKGSKVLDAYCGVGTLSLPLAAAGAQVLGLELQQSSVIHAQLNAELNSLTSAKFKHVDVSEALSLYLSNSDALILDPPRKGLHPSALTQIIDTPLPQIAYLSCNPSTLARDLKLLTLNKRFELTFIQPIDFFPQTTHVECLAILNSA